MRRERGSRSEQVITPLHNKKKRLASMNGASLFYVLEKGEAMFVKKCAEGVCSSVSV